MKILLIEPPIIIDAVLPVIFFEVEIVVEDVLSIEHFSIFPLGLIEASLSERALTLG